MSIAGRASIHCRRRDVQMIVDHENAALIVTPPPAPNSPVPTPPNHIAPRPVGDPAVTLPVHASVRFFTVFLSACFRELNRRPGNRRSRLATYCREALQASRDRDPLHLSPEQCRCDHQHTNQDEGIVIAGHQICGCVVNICRCMSEAVLVRVRGSRSSTLGRIAVTPERTDEPSSRLTVPGSHRYVESAFHLWTTAA